MWDPWPGGLPVPSSALLCIFTPKDSRCLCPGRGLASSRVAGSAPRAARQGCSGESASVGCPTTGGGTSGQADLSLAGRPVSTLLLLLCGCSGWDLDARGPFRAGAPTPPKGVCSPEQWYRDDSLLLILSCGEIPSLFGQTSSLTAAAPAQGKGRLLEGLKATLRGKWFSCLGLSGKVWGPKVSALSSWSVHQNISR